MLLEKPYWVVEYLGCHTAKSLVSKVVQFQVFQIIIQSTHDASNYGNKNRPLTIKHKASWKTVVTHY